MVFQEAFQILHFFFEKFAVGEQFVNSNQRDGTFQLEQHFERVGDVCLRLAFEEAFVPALAETRRGVRAPPSPGTATNPVQPDAALTTARRLDELKYPGA